jgi:hypothetical protein
MMMTKKKRKPKVRRVMLTNEELKQLKQGPLQHGGLTPPQQEVARRSFMVAGRFVEPTLEQWELGFMRDMHPDGELALWVVLSVAFQKYLRVHHVKDQKQQTRIVAALSIISSGGRLTGPENAKLDAELRALWFAERGRNFKETWGELVTMTGGDQAAD